MYLLKQDSDCIVVDCETTGVNPEQNAVVSIAVAVCDPLLNVRRRKVFIMRPHEGAVIEPKAMEINGLSLEQINSYPPPAEALKSLNSFLFSSCKGQPRFALWYCWGVGFDDKFIIKTFERAGVPYYGRRVWVCMRGVATYLNLFSSLICGRDKTETKNVRKFCEFLGVTFEGAEHDPMADVLNSIKVIRLSTARLLRLSQEDDFDKLVKVDGDLKNEPVASITSADYYGGEK
jgi:DNA polymerase III epsilon subunit-like protein